MPSLTKIDAGPGLKWRLILRNGVMVVIFGALLALPELRHRTLSSFARDAVWRTLTLTFGFGVLFGVMGEMDKRLRKRVHLPLKGRWEAVGIESDLRVDRDSPQVYRRALRICSRTRKWRITSSNETTGRIDVQIGRSWRSLGENLSIQIEQASRGTCQVVVRSTSKHSSMIADYGKNGLNVMDVVSALASPP